MNHHSIYLPESKIKMKKKIRRKQILLNFTECEQAIYRRYLKYFCVVVIGPASNKMKMEKMRMKHKFY